MKCEDAYFTVEAALVFPIAVGVVLFVIYMLLFQYDRCLLEQDMGAAALWGACQDAEGAVLEEKVRERLAGIYRDKYVAWEITALDALVEKNGFTAQGWGRLTLPVPRWDFGNGGNVWEAGACYRFGRLSPVTFIRLCRRFKKNVEGTEYADVDNAAER